MKKYVRTTLEKGGHRWVFICQRSEIPQICEHLAEMVRAGDTPFGWFEAALIAHKFNEAMR